MCFWRLLQEGDLFAARVRASLDMDADIARRLGVKVKVRCHPARLSLDSLPAELPSQKPTSINGLLIPQVHSYLFPQLLVSLSKDAMIVQCARSCQHFLVGLSG